MIYLFNKEEIDMNLDLVTESKVTECNRMSFTIFYAEISVTGSAGGLGRTIQMSFPEHVSEMCPDTRGALHIIEK